MGKLLMWERCRGKGREGINDVVFCVVLAYSITYIAIIQAATKNGGRRGHYEGTNIVQRFPDFLFNYKIKIFR
jgi:hypothetical protein